MSVRIHNYKLASSVTLFSNLSLIVASVINLWYLLLEVLHAHVLHLHVIKEISCVILLEHTRHSSSIQMRKEVFLLIDKSWCRSRSPWLPLICRRSEASSANWSLWESAFNHVIQIVTVLLWTENCGATPNVFPPVQIIFQFCRDKLLVGVIRWLESRIVWVVGAVGWGLLCFLFLGSRHELETWLVDEKFLFGFTRVINQG